MSDRVQTTFKRYICELCGGRYGDPGQCRSCEGVRLRDLADPAVQTWISSQDAARRNQRLRTVALVAPVLALPLPFLVPELSGPLPVGPEVIWVIAALVLGAVLLKVFPAPRLAPALSAGEQRALRAIHTESYGKRRPAKSPEPQGASA